MKAVKTRYDENRLKGLLAVGSLSLLSTGSKNFLQSVNTDIIQVNAEKQAKAGFNAKIVRRTEPNCCSWCASLAGTYTPEEAKAKGIYARHEGCVCTIDFYPSKGKRQRISNYMKDAKTQEKLAAASGREERIALAKEMESGIINNNHYLRTTDDSIREILGPAEHSHPIELEKILDDLKKSGANVKRRDGVMEYFPAISPGMPGEIIIEPKASYGAWLHEYKHFCDDRDEGYLGMRVLSDIEKCRQRERDAYQQEIDLAKKIGREDIVKRLQELLQKELERYEI